MTKIVIDIKSCKECPFFKTTPYPTSDSWERAENWWCSWFSQKKCEADKKIAGYVEWHDDIKVPDWCPISLSAVRNDKIEDILND